MTKSRVRYYSRLQKIIFFASFKKKNELVEGEKGFIVFISICFCFAYTSAAMVAVNLLSTARLILKLDNVYSEYSAQYLVDSACTKKVTDQGEMDNCCCKLAVKDGLKFAMKEGIAKEKDWKHLRSRSARISMK